MNEQLELDLQLTEAEYRRIPLTAGQFALVDDADFEWLSKWKWEAAWQPRTKTFYVYRGEWWPEKKRQRTVYMAREIMKPPPGVMVDHKSGNTLDNRRSN